jgi:hypothetical protein
LIGGNQTILLGTFLVAFSLLFFEVFSTIVMSFVLGAGYIYFIIGIALLGLSAAASMMSVIAPKLNDRRRALALYWACILLAILLVINLILVVQFKQEINFGIELAAREGGIKGIVRKLLSAHLWVAVWIGAQISIPYFLFGAIISLIFKTSPSLLFHKLYFADLVGAALGCVMAIVSLEWGGYALTAVIPSILAMLAGAVYLYRYVRPRVTLLATLFALSPLALLAPSLVTTIEPEPQLNNLARDYEMKQQVTELWHSWNSYSRVSALRTTDAFGRTQHIMALGNGEGHADFRPYLPEGYPDLKHRLSLLGSTLGAPKTALILFAGTGSDMLALDFYTKQQTSITGVELNHTMIRGALGLADFNLRAFYGQPNIRMVVSEAREFLEQDERSYDLIMLSWSGATTAYYSGAIAHTTQFVYTREAFEAMLDRLSSDGFIIVYNTNKVNSLATFRSIMEERGGHSAHKSAIVLFEPGTEGANWNRYWDENPLIFKPSGFSSEEIRQFAAVGRQLGMQVAYAPDVGAHPEFKPYDRVLKEADLSAALRGLNQESGLRFSVVTDDRPYSMDLFNTERYLRIDFWNQLWNRAVLKPYENYRVQQMMFVIVILVSAIVLILGPVFVRGGPLRNRVTLEHFLFFSVLGTGFMLVEIGLIHKMGLLLSNPAFSIAIVLAGLIFFTGIGSLSSKATFERGLGFQSCVLFVVCYLTGFILLSDSILPIALSWPLGWRIALALGIISPLGFALGHLFPQGLVQANRDGNAYLPWAWAINGAMSTIAAGIAPLLAQAFGFQTLLLAGAAIFLIVLMLPTYRQRTVGILAKAS